MDFLKASMIQDTGRNDSEGMIQEVIELKQEVKKTRQEKEKFILELEDCEAINSSLYKTNEILQNEISNLNGDLEKRQQTVVGLQNQVQTLTNERNDLIYKIKILKEENEKQRSFVNITNENLKDNQSKISELSLLINELNLRLQSSQQALENEKKNMGSSTNSYLRQLQERDDQIKQLRLLIDRLQKEYQEKYQEVSLKYLKMQKMNSKLFKMLDMCEGLLDDNFEKVLEDSLASMTNKKQMKNDITSILETCALSISNSATHKEQQKH